MARKDALIRLHKRLLGKRDALRGRIRQEMENAVSSRLDVGDVGDAANDGERTEIDSQLASLESRELRQIERALGMMKEGRYGKCEACDKAIHIERLNALPFTPLCIKCQREMEEEGRSLEDFQADWENAYDFQARMNDRELSISDIDVD